jgi:fluoroquinolone transport system permease protein
MDALSVRRDAMLRWMIFLPLLITAAVRIVLPLLITRLDSWLPLDLQPLYRPLMGALFFLLVPFLWGMLSGFLLLDQRDDHTLAALQITPLPLRHYLLYRLGAPTALGAVTVFILFPLADLGSLPVGARLMLALGAAPLAPLVALLMAALARNKVQGMALTKASGLLIVPALAAYFLPLPWRWLAAIAPTFWPAEALWQALQNSPSSILYTLGGIAYQFLLIGLLSRRFERIMHR